MSVLAALLFAQVAASAPADDYKLVNPRAIELFERDQRLMQWALSKYDGNGDGYLSIFEADKAAGEFRQIADGDRDGQVTPAEYRSAWGFIVARWGDQVASTRSR